VSPHLGRGKLKRGLGKDAHNRDGEVSFYLSFSVKQNVFFWPDLKDLRVQIKTNPKGPRACKTVFFDVWMRGLIQGQ
jgi:hypothetical protein